MYDRILVPVDGSDTSMRGLLEAVRLAEAQSSQMRLLHIVNLSEAVLVQSAYPGSEVRERLREEGKRALEQAAARAREAGAHPEATLLETAVDNVGELIVRHAHEWPADVIVMGTHGRRGLSRLLLGSVAEFVLRYAEMPVLMVRGVSS